MQVIDDIAGRVGAGQINEKVDFMRQSPVGRSAAKRLAVFIGDHEPCRDD